VKAVETNLKDVLVINLQSHLDTRGFFLESFNKEKFSELGIKYEFVQDNFSRSTRGVLRGLHFQKNNPQGKLVRCSSGAVLDVVLDIDPKSPTFLDSVAIELTCENSKALWIPPGYAHGFYVLSDFADFSYKCTDFYYPDDQYGIIWNDPDAKIPWPTSKPIMSQKDLSLPLISKYLAKR